MQTALVRFDFPALVADRSSDVLSHLFDADDILSALPHDFHGMKEPIRELLGSLCNLIDDYRHPELPPSFDPVPPPWVRKLRTAVAALAEHSPRA